MILRVFLAVLLAATPCWPQEIAQASTQTSSAQSPVAQPPPSQDITASAAPQSQSSPSQTITVPAGTRIPLSLSGQITSKSRAGDPVRAITAFPVTVDTQVAIPVGTYVEGVIDSVSRRTPSAQIHFTRIVFANGYSMSLQAESVQAKMVSHDQTSPTLSALTSPTLASPPSPLAAFESDNSVALTSFAAPSSDMQFAETAYAHQQFANPEFRQAVLAAPSTMLATYNVSSRTAKASPILAIYAVAHPSPQQQQPPPLPSPPSNHVGLAVGIGVAFTAAFVLLLVLVGRHRGAINGIVFDNGWQFQMVLQNPLTIDLSKVSLSSPEPAATN